MTNKIPSKDQQIIIAKEILSIQVELGMMVMSLMADTEVDDKTEQMTLEVLSMMQAKVVGLLDLSMDEVKEVWKEVKCGIRDLNRKLTAEQRNEIADIMLNGKEGRA